MLGSVWARQLSSSVPIVASSLYIGMMIETRGALGMRLRTARSGRDLVRRRTMPGPILCRMWVSVACHTACERGSEGAVSRPRYHQALLVRAGWPASRRVAVGEGTGSLVDARPEDPAAGLLLMGSRPPFWAYIAEAWNRRNFAFTLAAYRLVGGLLRNRLGVMWIVLKPLLMAILYGTIFNFVLSGAARPANFVQFLLVGIFIYEFFTGSFGNGAKAVTGNARLVQSLGFPRILLPVAVVAEQAMKIVPVVILLAILLLVLGEPIAWTWLLIVPVLALMAIFNLGVALIFARLSVHLRDVLQFIPVITRVLFYASGIIFSIDGALAGYPTLLTIAHLIPTYEFIALSRDVLLQGYAAPTLAWIAAPIWAVASLVVGIVFFWQAEARYGLND